MQYRIPIGYCLEQRKKRPRLKLPLLITIILIFLPAISVLILLASTFLVPEISWRISASSIPESLPICTASLVNSSVDNLLIIPKLAITTDFNTDEDQRSLAKSAWLLPWTRPPNEAGNSVIAVHLFQWFSQRQPFLLLKQLQKGDLIYLNWQQHWYTFRVEINELVPNTDISIEDSASERKILTIYTCELLQPTFRRVIVAGLISNCYNQTN